MSGCAAGNTNLVRAAAADLEVRLRHERQHDLRAGAGLVGPLFDANYTTTMANDHLDRVTSKVVGSRSLSAADQAAFGGNTETFTYGFWLGRASGSSAPWYQTAMDAKRLGWSVSVVLGLIIALAGILWADAQSDLDSAKRDHDSLKAKTEELKDRLDKYLEQSRGLRSMDKDQLDSLVEKLCRLDLEPDDREVDSIAKDLTERVVDQVRRRYEETARAGMEMVGLIERHLDNVKALRNRAKDLRSQDAVKDAASRLVEDAERLVEAGDKLMEKVQSDLKTLDRVKEGVMNGANNPIIRAKMEYGKEKHKSLQSSRSCDEREVVLSSGRPDCVKFESDDCKVIEFKPDTYSTGDAETQARKYVDDVRRKYKDDDRAKKCKRDADGYPIFRPIGETYTACRG